MLTIVRRLHENVSGMCGICLRQSREVFSQMVEEFGVAKKKYFERVLRNISIVT